MFTSGLVFEVSKAEQVGQMDIPYSMAFSNQRVGLIGVYSDDDIACAKWIVDNGESTVPIRTDYFGHTLIVGYNGIGTSYYRECEDRHYLFLGSWNTRYGVLVLGWDEGRRTYEPIPDLFSMRELFRQGDAVIYEVNYE
jgi:hypothetical protein